MLGESPWLVIDGAHNVASAKALAETLLNYFPATPRTLIFGTTRDKDLGGQLRALLPLFDTRDRHPVRSEPPGSVAPEDIAAAIEAMSGRTAQITHDPGEALDLARRLTGRGVVDLRHRLALSGRRGQGASCSGQEILRAGTGVVIMRR